MHISTMVMSSSVQILSAPKNFRLLIFPQKIAKNLDRKSYMACITDTGISQKQGAKHQDRGLISNYSERNQNVVPAIIILTVALIVVTCLAI
jgi:hypothetical protein